MEIDDIVQIVSLIYNKVIEPKHAELYETFINVYPVLYQHVIAKRFNIEWFYMLMQTMYSSTEENSRKRKNNRILPEDLDSVFEKFYDSHNESFKTDYIN